MSSIEIINKTYERNKKRKALPLCTNCKKENTDIFFLSCQNCRRITTSKKGSRMKNLIYMRVFSEDVNDPRNVNINQEITALLYHLHQEDNFYKIDVHKNRFTKMQAVQKLNNQNKRCLKCNNFIKPGQKPFDFNICKIDHTLQATNENVFITCYKCKNLLRKV